jgi:hypothetical protein
MDGLYQPPSPADLAAFEERRRRIEHEWAEALEKVKAAWWREAQRLPVRLRKRFLRQCESAIADTTRTVQKLAREYADAEQRDDVRAQRRTARKISRLRVVLPRVIWPVTTWDFCGISVLFESCSHPRAHIQRGPPSIPVSQLFFRVFRLTTT